MSTWNVLFDKNNNILPYERKIENRAYFPNCRWKVPPVDVQWQKNEYVNIYFLHHFFYS